ncbi:hypothetical protein EJ08DRAFT_646036 [Tothia fuscella]|uniref:AB hydrolase-1 domain-containing protein n=1 Tax=Tothia fuscella TaxID=1048955 RepID=A0A9P4NZ52_9PEZI|nr:hypothetical protein EJ08DRAFT_646036 [Tothia fuscella]
MVAYYELLPLSPAPTHGRQGVSRVQLVHGIQTPASGLHPLAKALSSRFQHAHFVLADLGGHGLTDTPMVAHDPTLFHALLKTLLLQLRWDIAHLIGYSSGGSTVTTFTAAFPGRVASIVLLTPAGLMRTAQFDELERSYLRGGESVEEEARAWKLEILEGGALIVPSDWEERVQRGEVVAKAVKTGNERSMKGMLPVSWPFLELEESWIDILSLLKLQRRVFQACVYSQNWTMCAVCRT